jgi:hypothetical protein
MKQETRSSCFASGTARVAAIGEKVAEPRLRGAQRRKHGDIGVVASIR